MLDIKKPELVEEVEFGDLGLDGFSLEQDDKSGKPDEGVTETRQTAEECEYVFLYRKDVVLD